MAKFYKAKKYKSKTNIKQIVRKELDKSIEDKIQYSNLGNFVSVGNAWIENSLTDIAQGTELWNRIGRSIRLRSLEIRGALAQGSTETAADDAWNVIRIVVGLYSNKSITPLASGGATLNTPITPKLCSNGQLLRKFMDKYVALNVTCNEQGAGDGYTPQVRTFKYFKKFKKPILINYNGANLGDANKHLQIGMLSDSALAVHPGFVCGFWKLCYEDA